MANLIDPNYKFEPSVGLKKLFLYINKTSKSYGRVRFPGLFGSHNYGIMAAAFVLTMALEVWGFVNLSKVIGSPIYALLFVFGDIVFAFCAHLFVGHILLAKNKRVLAENGFNFTLNKTHAFDVKAQNQKIVVFTVFKLIFDACILAIAFLKVSNYLLHSIDVPALKWAMVLNYVVVAALHIRCTGHFLFEAYLRYRLSNQRSMVEDTDETHPSKYTIVETRNYNLPKDIAFDPVHFLKTEIKNEDQGQMLTTWGLLQDDVLNGFVGKQPTPQKNDTIDLQKELALYCLYVQVKYHLQAEPLQNINNPTTATIVRQTKP